MARQTGAGTFDDIVMAQPFEFGAQFVGAFAFDPEIQATNEPKHEQTGSENGKQFHRCLAEPEQRSEKGDKSCHAGIFT